MCAISIYVHISGAERKVRHYLTVDAEGTPSAWFSSSQLLIVGIIFLLHQYWLKPEQISRPGYLKLVGLGFLFMSLDEASSIHERWLNKAYDFGLDHSSWAVYYLIFGLVMLLIGLKPLRDFHRLLPSQSRNMALGLILFITGGVVLEFLGFSLDLRSGGVVLEFLGFSLDLRSDRYGLLYGLQVVLEEFLEMFGITVILCSLLSCVQVNRNMFLANVSKKH